jgi:hypothetical protein
VSEKSVARRTSSERGGLVKIRRIKPRSRGGIKIGLRINAKGYLLKKIIS